MCLLVMDGWCVLLGTLAIRLMLVSCSVVVYCFGGVLICVC